MTHLTNMAIQVLPRAGADAYSIIDKAIAVIQKSGLKHQVCPFETVVEGSYSDLMKLLDDVQLACFNAGCDEILVNIKLHRKKDKDVRISDKMEKY